ncbi:hypothetical protein ACIRU2_12360 [Streptomyces sp. NPDC101169]|uniref:hypothetical protein n=1 Tax=Streptomyces sp. NPDC101169 TaxID=3366121 RepID=UPI0037F6FE48
MNGGRGRFTGRAGRTRPARGPWAVVCAVAAVVLGPAAAATATASALDRADAAPPHHPAPAGTSDRPPADTTRRWRMNRPPADTTGRRTGA